MPSGWEKQVTCLMRMLSMLLEMMGGPLDPTRLWRITTKMLSKEILNLPRESSTRIWKVLVVLRRARRSCKRMQTGTQLPVVWDVNRYSKMQPGSTMEDPTGTRGPVLWSTGGMWKESNRQWRNALEDIASMTTETTIGSLIASSIIVYIL